MAWAQSKTVRGRGRLSVVLLHFMPSPSDKREVVVFWRSSDRGILMPSPSERSEVL